MELNNYCVKNDGSKEFKEFLKWWNKNYHWNAQGSHEYYGVRFGINCRGNSPWKKEYSAKEFMSMIKKEIIGYKCPMDMFCGEVNKGEIFTVNRNPAFFSPNNLNGKTNKRDYYSIPKEVVETWEPVYKEVDTEFNMGEFKLVVSATAISHKGEDITRYCKEMYELNNLISVNLPKSYTTAIGNVSFSKTGCENSKTTLQQWVDVYEKYLSVKSI